MADIKGPMMRKGMTTMVGPIHFEDFDGANLERLVFAYLLRAESWDSVEWYGQVGSDSGRDIWASRRLVGEVLCVQCVNQGCLSLVKAKDDIGKVLAAHNGTPSVFRFVCRSSVSAKLKDAVKKHALNNGIRACELWSGKEFEEHLRAKAETLLQRFVNGEVFPDAAPEIKSLASRLAASVAMKPTNHLLLCCMLVHGAYSEIIEGIGLSVPFDENEPKDHAGCKA